MHPVDISPLEERQFALVTRKFGADPSDFELRKLQAPAGVGYRVRVAGRGAATVYTIAQSDGWLGDFAKDMERGLFGNHDADAIPAAVATALSEVERALVAKGIAGALAVLNARVPHRFTAVYRVVAQVAMHNVAVIDKHLHLDALDLKVVPLKDSFCQFALRDGIFLTRDSGEDARLKGHPYSGVVGCYMGVPIKDHDGRLQGTLCHFDLESHEVEDDEYLLLDCVARRLPAFVSAT